MPRKKGSPNSGKLLNDSILKIRVPKKLLFFIKKESEQKKITVTNYVTTALKNELCNSTGLNFDTMEFFVNN